MKTNLQNRDKLERTAFCLARKKQIVAALAAVLVSPSASAIGPVAVAGYAPSGAAQFVSMVTSSVTTPVVQAFSQVTDGLKTVLVQSNAEIATQMEARQIEAIKKERAAQAMQEQQPASDACADQTGAAYAGSVDEIAQALKKNAMARARARSGGAPSAPEQAMHADRVHANVYCNPDTVPGGRCEKNAKPDSVAPRSVDLKDADVAAEKSLFSENLTHTPDQQMAATDFIANVIDSGNAPRKPTKAEHASAEGKKYEGLRQVYLARISMAQGALNDIAVSRAAIPGAREILDEIKKGSPAGGASSSYLAKREAALRKTSPNGDLSQLELMDIEVGRRADNPDWYEAVNTQMNPAALAKEQTLMMAMMLKMQYRIYRQNELQSALNAQQVVEAAKSGMRDQLTRAEQAMLRGKAK